MNALNKWAAKQCGVAVVKHINGLVIKLGSKVKVNNCTFWTLDDARCREIVREHFNISTQRHFDRGGELIWYSEALSTHFDAYGKTIQEAEVEAITAIYEAENDE